ncbi:ABC transporter permease [Streptomyces sp. NPDC050535]|uniref:ABC transporter permease n=1 Tax=Streptomyces sp. NPDC050535 TaxID=3365626 RepID=UPI0037A773A3
MRHVATASAAWSRRCRSDARSAFGAARGHIRLRFLTESIALSTLGGLAGTVLGVLATLAYTAYQGWPPVISLSTVAGGVAGTVLVGVIAGLYPSLRAARLAPTEALASA